MKYIAIDIGSSYVKSALIDLEAANIVAEEKLPSPPRRATGDPRLYEVPAALYVEQVRKLIEGYATRYEDVEGVVFSTQMHGFVYHTPGREDIYVSWQDMRCLNERGDTGESYMAHLERRFPAEAMVRSGVRVKPSLGMCNLFALLDREPELPRDGELFTIGSYVIHDLTGRNVCHAMNAAPLGLMDVREHRWDRERIEALGFGDIRFPEIAGSDDELCGICRIGGRALKVFPDYGDQQTAILGSGAAADEAVINIATSSQVSVTVDSFRPGEYEIRPFFGRRYINTISNMPGGRVLNVLIQFLRGAVGEIAAEPVSEARIWEVVHAGFAPETRGIEVDTSFYARPGFLDGGSIRGILPENLSIHTLFAAAYRDMARMYRENIAILNGNLRSYVCAGGVSWKTPELLRVIEAEAGVTCRLSAISDECLAGLYRMALVCSGLEDGEREARPLKLRTPNE